MSTYETAYFAPPPIGSDLNLHADPKDFYGSDNQSGVKHHGRMRLNRILNNSASDQSHHEEQHLHQQHQESEDHYQSHTYQGHSSTFQSLHSPVNPVQVSTFPVSPVASLSPRTPLAGSPVPTGMPTNLATMSTFSGVNQPNMALGETMPYSYPMPQYDSNNQTYTLKHAGHVRSMAQVEYGSEPTPSYASEGHHYYYNNSSQSPDPSGGSSPTAFSSYHQQYSVMAEHSYPFSNPPANGYYHTQHYPPSPYGTEHHSPYSNSSYSTSYTVPEAQHGYSPTPPATPLYAVDNHYAAGASPTYRPQADVSQPGPRTKRATSGRVRGVPTGSKTSKSVERTPTSTSAQRRFQCHECEKAFPTKGELASHSRCHLKVPAFLCGVCGRPFKRRTDYVRHVRNVHEEVGRYSCAQCGERFGRLDKLKRHDRQGCGNDKEGGGEDLAVQ
ncbi:hypothetical protein BGZ83_011192 [Gryganskiella cystojenkinii]|nr:hypothetical protein BGZ83_011192 [Gryganskiella cystojenkinii]